MGNSNEAEEADFVNVVAGVDSDKEVGSQCSNTVFNLNVEPAEVHLSEQDQTAELLVDVLGKGFN